MKMTRTTLTLCTLLLGSTLSALPALAQSITTTPPASGTVATTQQANPNFVTQGLANGIGTTCVAGTLISNVPLNSDGTPNTTGLNLSNPVTSQTQNSYGLLSGLCTAVIESQGCVSPIIIPLPPCGGTTGAASVGACNMGSPYVASAVYINSKGQNCQDEAGWTFCAGDLPINIGLCGGTGGSGGSGATTSNNACIVNAPTFDAALNGNTSAYCCRQAPNHGAFWQVWWAQCGK